MLSLGFEPGAAGCKVQTDPLIYGGRLVSCFLHLKNSFS